MNYPEGGKIVDVCFKTNRCLVQYQQDSKIWQEWHPWRN